MNPIHGIIPPVITPMRPDEELDLSKFRGFIDHLIHAGVHALFVLGTNSEAYALDEREKQELMATAVQHVNRRLPVLAGTGAPTTRETIRLTKLAEKEGVDAVSVITPYFIAPSQQEMIDHYRRVSEATSLPLMLYNNPSQTGGVKLAPESVAKLSVIPNIVAIKDSSGDLQNTLDYLRSVPATFAVLQGRDTLLWPSLLCGCAGGVPASANVAPQLCVEIYEAFRRGDQTAAESRPATIEPRATIFDAGHTTWRTQIGFTHSGSGYGTLPVAHWPTHAGKEAQMRAVLVGAGLI